MVDTDFSQAKELSKGSYVMIDDVPCKIKKIETSKPGKHGSTKMRIQGKGIFENQTKTLLTPADAEVKVPIIKRKTVQVMSASGNNAKVMDQETYDVYNIKVPEELQSDMEPGAKADILEAVGQRKIKKVRSEE